MTAGRADRRVAGGRLVLCAAMRVEAAAIRPALPAGCHDGAGSAGCRDGAGSAGCRDGAGPVALLRTGTGRAAARRAARSVRARGAGAVVVVGIGGGLWPGLRTGDVVVADEVRSADGTVLVRCVPAGRLVEALRRRGLTVRVGRVVSTRWPVWGPARRRLARRAGALAVDTESAWLLAGLDVPCGCVRVVADALPDRLITPRTLRRVRRALRVLPAVADALARTVPAPPGVPAAGVARWQRPPGVPGAGPAAGDAAPGLPGVGIASAGPSPGGGPRPAVPAAGAPAEREGR